MKCTIPEISWHNRDPILSVDIQPVNNEFYKLASGGTDCHVLLWHLKICENGSVDVHIVSDLTRHQRSVNVVRWSPTGTYLASGDDDANIIVWNLRTDNIPLLEGDTNDEETWIVTKVLRGHKEDVYDISWSPNELKLISGSIDNTAILWDVAKGQSESILLDHKGFVQGVSWDPKGEYIATICSDRICRVFDNTGKHVKARIHKGHLPVSESHILCNQEVKYFHDDTFKSYFRRLNFSPDGNLLFVPSGCIETGNDKVVRNATYIFTLDVLTEPAAIIQSRKQVTIAVRCCPILFELHSDGVDPLIDLPYRMIIAVATDSDVILYDTQQVSPFAHFRKIHYTRITDLTWSSDGLLLIASSTDGFCTLITFEPDELGLQYVKDESDTEDIQMDVSGCEEIGNLDTSIKNKENEEIETKKPNILEKWTIRTPKSEGNAGILPTREARENKDEVISNQPKRLVPKRIVPTRVIDAPKHVTDANTQLHDNDKKTDLDVIEDTNSTQNNKSELSNSITKEDLTCNKNKHKMDSKKNKSTILRFLQIANDTSPAINKTDQNAKNTSNNLSDSVNSSDLTKTKNCTDSNIIEILDSDSNASGIENCANLIPNVLNNVTDKHEQNKCQSIQKKNMDTLGIDSSDLKKKGSIRRFLQITNDKSPTINKTDQNVVEIAKNISNNISDSENSSTKLDKKNCTDSDTIQILDSDDDMPVTENCSADLISNNLLKTVSDQYEQNKCLPIEKENMEVLTSDNSDSKKCVPITETSENKKIAETKTNLIKTPRRIPFVTLGSPKRKKKE